MSTCRQDLLGDSVGMGWQRGSFRGGLFTYWFMCPHPHDCHSECSEESQAVVLESHCQGPSRIHARLCRVIWATAANCGLRFLGFARNDNWVARNHYGLVKAARWDENGRRWAIVDGAASPCRRRCDAGSSVAPRPWIPASAGTTVVETVGVGGRCRWWGYPSPAPGSPIGVGDDGCGGFLSSPGMTVWKCAPLSIPAYSFMNRGSSTGDRCLCWIP